MNLTVKEEKLLKKLKKTWKNRYGSYIGFCLGAIVGITCIVKGVIVENNYTLMSGYFILLLVLLFLWYFSNVLRLHTIIEKLEGEIESGMRNGINRDIHDKENK